MKPKFYIPCLLALLSISFTTHAQYIISTAAGDGYNAGKGYGGFSGDGGLAISDSCELDEPADVILDGAGNIYIADYFNNRIRKVSTNGIITTIAGNGQIGYTGDGGPATAATFDGPIDLAIDDTGNIYISDIDNNVIRKLNTNGNISTVAGDGFGSGLGTGNGGYSGDNGQATAAELNAPFGVAWYNGNIYIGDGSNHRIRKVNSSGIITTISGNGTYGSVGDGGPATAAEFEGITGVATDDSGNVYIVDFDGQVIRKINTHDTINTFAGTGNGGYSGDGGPATAAQLFEPKGVKIDAAGNVYIADEYNNFVREVNTNGIISTIAGSGTPTSNYGYEGNGGPATAALLDGPTGLALDKDGDIYISDQGNNVIRKLTNTSTGVKQSSGNSEQVSVYPNPNNGNFTLQLQNINQNTQIEIFNVLGENVYAALLNSINTQINLSSHPSGIYFYRILTTGGQVISNGKFVIE